MQWHYVVDGETFGPHSDEEVKSAVSSGKVNADTLVWREGMEDWLSLADIPELAAIMRPSTPPPLPRMKEKATPPPPPVIVDTPEPSLEVEPDRDVQKLVQASAQRRLAGPWTRYFARILDMSLLATVVGAAFIILASHFSPVLYLQLNTMDGRVLFLLTLPFVHVVNALIITVAGNSPAKALFGIKAVPLDVDRSTPFTFKENLVRELNVWVRGLGFGFPLITLFTMIAGYNKVSKGLPTGYDQGKATVLSFSDSTPRRAGMMLLAAAVLIGFGALNVMDQNEQRRIARPYSWTNPETGIQTTIPANWQYEEVDGPEKNTLYGFTNMQTGVVVLLGVERFDGAELSTYADAFQRGVSSHMSLGEWQSSPIDGALKSTGTMVSSPSNAVTVHVIQRGSAFWRAVFVDQTGRTSGEIVAPDMTSALFRTASQ